MLVFLLNSAYLSHEWQHSWHRSDLLLPLLNTFSLSHLCFLLSLTYVLHFPLIPLQFAIWFVCLAGTGNSCLFWSLGTGCLVWLMLDGLVVLYCAAFRCLTRCRWLVDKWHGCMGASDSEYCVDTSKLCRLIAWLHSYYEWSQAISLHGLPVLTQYSKAPMLVDSPSPSSARRVVAGARRAMAILNWQTTINQEWVDIDLNFKFLTFW